ncbi:cold-shock protein [Streptomyces griseorubiginosus]|uniref:cold-shock protein n=1 Tax=Streptomyces griseorubiginosus TaxID=67304 RepID=UPI001AD78766|nr:cold shock domain-containing protein [Streptomyces griseorubiginosus]MBO4253338.1 cold shock domain-containing protein [Streptomyces griseorubiginosus]
MIDASVRVWHDEEGWGVLDSPQTPGGCWAHFSAIEMAGFRSLSVGQVVALEWEAGEQDGWHYRAVRVVPADTESAN